MIPRVRCFREFKCSHPCPRGLLTALRKTSLQHRVRVPSNRGGTLSVRPFRDHGNMTVHREIGHSE